MEFAMVAVPFLLMIFSILELGVVFILDSVLETATMESGRLVRTGQAEARGFDKAAFKTELCNRMILFKNDCTSRATVDVRVIPAFSRPDTTDPIANGAVDDTKTRYDGGKPGNIILVRVWYVHPLATPFVSQAVSRVGVGKVLLATATAFQNEPWNAS